MQNEVVSFFENKTVHCLEKQVFNHFDWFSTYEERSLQQGRYVHAHHHHQERVVLYVWTVEAEEKEA